MQNTIQPMSSIVPYIIIISIFILWFLIARSSRLQTITNMIKNTIITSTRYVSFPIVNKIVNNLAFHPPKRSQIELHELKNHPDHNFVSNENYKISYFTAKPVNYEPKIRKCILFSHGNGADIISMIDFCTILANEFKMNTVCYDYPGYGLSIKLSDNNDKTYPTELGCYASIKIMMDYLKDNYDIIYIVGQSIGTGVCVDYCANNTWTTPIILISPYTSIARVISDTTLTSSIDSSFNSYEKINLLKCPVRIIHGDADTLIDISHGKTMYQALPDKTLDPIWLEGVGHNDILSNIGRKHLRDVFELE